MYQVMNSIVHEYFLTEMIINLFMCIFTFGYSILISVFCVRHRRAPPFSMIDIETWHVFLPTDQRSLDITKTYIVISSDQKYTFFSK